MTITIEGNKLLDELKDVMDDIMGLINITRKELKINLVLRKVLLVPGSFDSNNSLIKDVAKCGYEYFLSILKDGDTSFYHRWKYYARICK